MVLWIIVGLIVWTLCVLFTLVIIEGGHRVRRHEYEQKLYSRNRVNTQNIEDSIKKKLIKLQEQEGINVCPYPPIHEIV